MNKLLETAFAEVADRLARLDALRGQSSAFEQHGREFRDALRLRERPSAWGMGRHLLDTNLVSYLADPASPFHTPARSELASSADKDEVALSFLSLFELHHWLAYRQAHRRTVEELVRDFLILPLPATAAERFGA